ASLSRRLERFSFSQNRWHDLSLCFFTISSQKPDANQPIFTRRCRLAQRCADVHARLQVLFGIGGDIMTDTPIIGSQPTLNIQGLSDGLRPKPTEQGIRDQVSRLLANKLS